MVKQKVHLRKVGNKLVEAGQGKKPTMVGKLVWHKGKVYTVTSQNKNGTYDIRNLTAKRKAENVKRSMLRKY